MSSKVVVIGLSGESVFLETDHFHRKGETIQVLSKYTEPGGKGYNQAIALSKFGCDVTYLTSVGNDEYSDYLIKYLADLGIKVKCKRLDGSCAYATILTDKDGNNQVSVYEGVANGLAKTDIKLIEEDIKKAKYLLIQLEINDETLLEACYIAKKYGVKIVLNPAPCRIDIHHKLCKLADIITPNEVEVRDLYNLPTDLDVMDYGDYLSKKIDQELVVTLGDKGSLHIKKDYFKYYEPLKVKSLDTTGAGDIFNAGLVTMLANDETIEEAILFASVAASISVTKKYVMLAIPTLEEVKKLRN